MKKLFNSLIIAIIVVFIPTKLWAQQSQYANNASTIEFDITSISLFDERVFFIYNLLNDNRFNVVDSEQDGVFVISASEVYENLDLVETFAQFREENATSFSAMGKIVASETARNYKGLLPTSIVNSLMMDIYIRSRQNNLCANADPFCTDNGMYEFPAGVNAGTGETGPVYGHPNGFWEFLSSVPNPAWYYMRILNPGDMDIYMYSTPRNDIDFCCWGPFDDPVSQCPYGLTEDKVVSVSYSPNASEHCLIPASAQTGEYYILVITNYSNQPCNINFSKEGGTGTTDCEIMEPIVNNSGPYCEGETIYLTASSQPNTTFSWTGPNNFSSTQQNPTIPNCTPSMSGDYICIISLDGESREATTSVVVYPQAVPSFDANNVCLGQPMQFTGTAPGINQANFTWDFGDGQNGSGQNVSHVYSQPGNYQVKLVVTNPNGSCPGEITQTMTVNAQPVADASGSETTVVYGSSAQLRAAGGTEGFTYRWDPSNMVVNPNAQNTQTVILTSDQTFTLTVTNPQGQCVDSDQITVRINGSSLATTIHADQNSICEGESTQLTVTASNGTGNYTYSWTPATGLSNPNIHNPVATPSQTTTYTCLVNDGQTEQRVTETITVNMMDIMPPVTISGECDSVHVTWRGQDTIFRANTVHRFTDETENGCLREQFYYIQNMNYTPDPEIYCTDEGVDPHYMITATEFNVNRYNFIAYDPRSEASWYDSQCEWTISKPSWRVIPNENNHGCSVYPMDWSQDTVWLTFKVINPCSDSGIILKHWMVSSFYDINEQPTSHASVSITPNPNNGEMELRIENMEGKINVRVCNAVGLTIDNFDIHMLQDQTIYNYTMRQLSNGVYFFIFSDGRRTTTQKAIIIQ